jgi:hypothetical protein
MTHDYRNATAQTAPVVRANALDLRLVGEMQSTLYVANIPVTGAEARKQNLTGMGTVQMSPVVALQQPLEATHAQHHLPHSTSLSRPAAANRGEART